MDKTRKTAEKILDCSVKKFESTIRKIKKDGGKLVTISASSDKSREVSLQYFFDFMKNFILVKTKTQDLAIGSLYVYFPNSDFIEREINLSFGVKFLGNPNLEKSTG